MAEIYGFHSYEISPGKIFDDVGENQECHLGRGKIHNGSKESQEMALNAFK